MSLLDRIRRRLRPRPTSKPRPEPGRRLADGTILERCRLVAAAELKPLLTPQGTPQLHIHWRLDDDCAHDLPDLRELHLFWAHHATFIGIFWGRALATPPPPLRESAAAVDAWHRDYGLTWESLLLDGGDLEAAGLTEPTLPQVILRGADGAVLFHRVGRLEAADRARLELVLRERCSGQAPVP